MGTRYPDHIPAALAEVLGMPPHELHSVWGALREVGVEVPQRYEGEVGSALHFLIRFAIEHPENWRDAAAAELVRMSNGAPLAPVRYLVSFDAAPVDVVETGRALDLVTALQAAVQALRSYQHGNSAPGLARDVADACSAVLDRARSPGGHSAHAELVDGKIRLSVLGTTDAGPAKMFAPLLDAELDEPHALELLGTLAVQHHELVEGRR